MLQADAPTAASAPAFAPQNIPLHLLNRKFISDINRLYGDYQAGETDNGRSPLVNFNMGDGEPCDFDKGGRE